MRRHRVLGPLLYIGVRLLVWLIVFDVVASVLVVRGAKPALALYIVAFAAALLAGLSFAGQELRPTATMSRGLGNQSVKGMVSSVSTPEPSRVRHLRALTGLVWVLLAIAFVGAGLYAERYAGTGKDPNTPCHPEGGISRFANWWHVCDP